MILKYLSGIGDWAQFPIPNPHPRFLNLFNYYFYLIKIIYYFLNKNYIGDWGLGIGDWGLGIGPNPQSPINILIS